MGLVDYVCIFIDILVRYVDEYECDWFRLMLGGIVFEVLVINVDFEGVLV